jgi:Zn-dependent protease/CBS domain-containing protein
MGWSIRLFDLGGTTLRIHPTFFLLLVWVAAVNWMQAGPAAAIEGVVFISILFLCVVLHEYGHVFAARRYGIRTRDITLLPIGGVASIERMPEKPEQEIVIALAGPAVNLVIALALMLLLKAPFDPIQMTQLEAAQSSMLARVAAANMALLLFNLIPAFPMDGGRVLRALLTIPLGYTRATRTAAAIGQGLAVLFVFWGLFGYPLLILIGVFIFMAASWEAGYAQAREYARGYLASHAIVSNFQPLSPSSTVDDAAKLAWTTSQQEFPVVDGAGVFRGVVTRDDIVAALRAGGGDTPVIDIMKRDVSTVPLTTCLDQVFNLLSASNRFVGVVDSRQRLVGYITPEKLAEFVMIRSLRHEDAVQPARLPRSREANIERENIIGNR